MDIVITTSLSNVGIALCKDNLIIAKFKGNMNDLIMIDDIFEKFSKENKVNLNEIDRVFIDIGPGGTSSVRTGVAVANAIAYANKAKLHPVLSSKLIIDKLDLENKYSIVCIHRSIRGNIFLSKYDIDGNFSIRYGELSTFVKILSDDDIRVITDEKMRKNLLRTVPDAFTSLSKFLATNDFGVDLDYFVKQRQNLSKQNVSLSSVAIPFTESQAKRND
jgi:tRNA A37 threonylcarbamoyladenosine modification protein TsaB